MAEIKYTETLNNFEGDAIKEGLLPYSFLSDERLITAVWQRDQKDTNASAFLLHELAFRFEALALA